MKRLGEMQDLDGLVLVQALDASRYIAGPVATIDGGYNF